MGTSFRSRIAAGMVALVLTLPAVAQSQAAPDPAARGVSAQDRQMLLNYRLSMDKLPKLVDATQKFRQLEKSNPKLAASLEKEQDQAQSLSAKIARMEKVPEIRATLASSGLTARDYVLSFLNVMNAGSAVQIKKMGGDPSTLPVSQQNVQFYRSNQAAIERMTKSLTAQVAADANGGEPEDSTPADSQ
jgi:hypothetical protein